jgi:hypothetical protein
MRQLLEDRYLPILLELLQMALSRQDPAHRQQKKLPGHW